MTLAELLSNEGVVRVVGRLLETQVHGDVEDFSLLLVGQAQLEQLLKGVNVVLGSCKGYVNVIPRSYGTQGQVGHQGRVKGDTKVV